MGKYKIVAYYRTGNSFGSEDTQSNVELQWNDLEIAKENLRRIKEHDEFQREVDNRFGNKTKDQLLKEAKNKPWFTDNKYGFYHCLNLLTDIEENCTNILLLGAVILRDCMELE